MSGYDCPAVDHDDLDEGRLMFGTGEGWLEPSDLRNSCTFEENSVIPVTNINLKYQKQVMRYRQKLCLHRWYSMIFLVIVLKVILTW